MESIAAIPAPAQRKRGTLFTLYLILVMGICVIGLVSFVGIVLMEIFLYHHDPALVFKAYLYTGAVILLWLVPMIALWKWKKWGLYGAFLVPSLGIIVGLVQGQFPLIPLIFFLINALILYFVAKPHFKQLD